MRTALAILIVAVAAVSAAATYQSAFADFKARYNKQYASPAEEAYRYQVFEHNMKLAEGLQAVNPLASFGASPYADRTAAEFKVYHNAEKHFAAKKATTKKTTVVSYTAAEMKAAAGKAIDWRKKGAVTGVKNQGQCGSCWSFSTTGGIEGQWFLAGNTLTSLSEQELVSCDTIDSGCNGGLMQNAYEWLLENRGGKIETEASYPYVSGDGNVPACADSGKTVGATISGHLAVTKTEDAMATWVYANGPLSIAVDATSWQTYTGGIMTNCASSQVDHGVLIVGFDDSNSPPYWVIKNSWGASWGESGYIRVKKGDDQCLITDDPVSSTVAAAGPTTPAPPVPPTPPTPKPTPQPPSPTPSGATFTQMQCQDSACSQGCTNNTFPQNTCLQLSSGGSATATCSSSGLTLTIYILSTDCTGFSFPSTQPVDQCLADTSGTYVENICGSSSSISGAKAAATKKMMLTGEIADRLRKIKRH